MDTIELINANNDIMAPDTMAPDTMAPDTIECDHCGDDYAQDSLQSVLDGSYVCVDCIQSDYTYCVDVEDYVPSENAYWCESRDHYFASDENLVIPYGSDHYWHVDDCLHSEDEGRYATLEYAADHWYWSERADAWYEEADNSPEYQEEDGAQESSSGIYPYDKNVMDILDYGTPCNPAAPRKRRMYVGVELEVQTKQSCLDTAVEVTNGILDHEFGVLKRDGSIGDWGFEIVTRPSNFVEQANTFTSIIAELKPMIDAGEVYSYKTGDCGLHVHVSRRALTELQIGKLQVFLNSAENSAFVDCVAQRRAASYHKRDTNLKITKKSVDRYVALNLQNYATIEFRIFRGTLKLESLLKSLEFVEALLEFTAPASASIKESVDYKTFLAWLNCPKHDRRKRWANLSQYLEQKGYLVIRKLAPTPSPAMANDASNQLFA